MLSHHELAKLVLINSAPDQIAIGDPDVGALVEMNLVGLFPRAETGSAFRITDQGISVLRKLIDQTKRAPIHRQRRA